MSRNQASIFDRWRMDNEDFAKKPPVLLTPQCVYCRNVIPGDALHCQVFQKESIPSEILVAKKECPGFACRNPIAISPAGPEQARLLGGIFGFCVGDALGVPVEFTGRAERDADPVQELRAYGTHKQEFGTWSDDTSLMLCLMDAILSGDLIPKLRDNMVAFLQQGRFTPRGRVFDVGISTRAAIQQMVKGVDPVHCGGTAQSDNGNGSLMRILPLAFLAPGMPEPDLIRLVTEVSSLTHAHPRSILCCLFYTVFARALYEGSSPDAAWREAAGAVERTGSALASQELQTLRGILSGDIRSAQRDQISSTGYVVYSLEAALWTLFHTDSYREAVLTAVNLGGDTDTIAALTGGLAGILYGVQSIPDNWIQALARKEDILKLTMAFADHVESSAT